jgi:hypothetical protein
MIYFFRRRAATLDDESSFATLPLAKDAKSISSTDTFKLSSSSTTSTPLLLLLLLLLLDDDDAAVGDNGALPLALPLAFPLLDFFAARSSSAINSSNAFWLANAFRFSSFSVDRAA